MAANFYGFDLEVRSRLLRGFNDSCAAVNLRYYLSCGTLLAAYRDRCWIPYDNDVDCDILAEEYSPEIHTNLQLQLNSRGIGLVGGYKSECVSARLEGEVLSMRRLHTEGGERCYRAATYPLHFWPSPATIEFDDRIHFVPYPVEEYLEYQYENWKVPSLATGNAKAFIEKVKARKAKK